MGWWVVVGDVEVKQDPHYFTQGGRDAVLDAAVEHIRSGQSRANSAQP